MKPLLLFLFIGMCYFSCKDKVASPVATERNFPYTQNISFNHLYVVIDEDTYRDLFDSIPFLKEFAYVSENTVDTKEESWSGKYISGNQHYLELFKPGGAENTEIGDFGLAFMTNAYGTLDSLHTFWTSTLDTVTKQTRTMQIAEDKTIPWFHSLSIPDTDSLAISPWVMEHTKEFMLFSGFKEEDLDRTINYDEYAQRSASTYYKIPYKEAAFDKLFERVSAIQLALSIEELEYLKTYLMDFGFMEESDHIFKRPDFEIRYDLDNKEHFILKQIDFELRDSVEKKVYNFKNVTFETEGTSARMKFKYQKE